MISDSKNGYFLSFSPPFVGMVYDASTQNANETKHFTKTVDVFMLLFVELIFSLEYCRRCTYSYVIEACGSRFLDGLDIHITATPSRCPLVRPESTGRYICVSVCYLRKPQWDLRLTNWPQNLDTEMNEWQPIADIQFHCCIFLELTNTHWPTNETLVEAGGSSSLTGARFLQVARPVWWSFLWHSRWITYFFHFLFNL